MILAWFELIYLLIKATLLSGAYAALLVWLLYLLCKIADAKAPQAVVKRRFLIWLFLAVPIFFGLFAYRLSYWQDMGMGETAMVPVGHGHVVYNADGFMTYFDSDPDNEVYLQEDHVHIGKYVIDREMLCAENSEEPTDSTYKYVVFNMQSNRLIRFTSDAAYDTYAATHKLPARETFKDFASHYNAYAAKKPTWKKWLLL